MGGYWYRSKSAILQNREVVADAKDKEATHVEIFLLSVRPPVLASKRSVSSART